MTYQEVKNQVLKLLNQYTIAGTTVADTYNNQADYIKRIPSLINDAMMELSTTVRKIEARCELTEEGVVDADDSVVGDVAVSDHQVVYCLPEDMYQFPSGSVFRYRDGTDGDLQRLSLFMLRGRKCIVLPKRALKAGGSLIYYRYPVLLPEEDANITASTELDNVPEVHRAIPYYVAGTLALHDDPFLASTLMNAYEDKLAKMQPEITAETGPVRDVYYPGRPYPYDYYC